MQKERVKSQSNSCRGGGKVNMGEKLKRVKKEISNRGQKAKNKVNAASPLRSVVGGP